MSINVNDVIVIDDSRNINNIGIITSTTVNATTLTGSGSGVTSLDASNLSSGTVPDARFPATLPAASGTNLTSLNASNLSSGTVPDARFPATLPAASGTNLTSLNASNLSSGTVATARLGSGTADSSSFLRGDGTWSVVDTTSIENGTSSVEIPSSGGNITATVGNQLIYTLSTSGLAMASGERFDVSAYSENVNNLGTVSGSVALDMGTYSVFTATISGTTSVTFTLSNLASNRLCSGTLILTFTGSGTRNVNFSWNARWPGGSAPTLSTSAATDIVTFFTPNAGSTTYTSLVGLGFA